MRGMNGASVAEAKPKSGFLNKLGDLPQNRKEYYQ